MKTKLLCFIGGILLISGLFCSCEKEPEVMICNRWAMNDAWDVPAKKGQLASEDEKTPEAFQLHLPEAEAFIARYQKKSWPSPTDKRSSI